MSRLSVLAVAVATSLLVACSAVDPVTDGSKRVRQAWAQHRPAPQLSGDFGKALTVAAAYRIQTDALRQTQASHPPAGFTAALTAIASRQHEGAVAPIAAVLPAGSQLRRKSSEYDYHVALDAYRQPVVAAEIGYRFSHDVRAPLPDVRALRAAVDAVLPAVELSDRAHAGDTFTAKDMIASNAGVRQFIAGPARAPSVTDPDTVTVTVYRDGHVATSGGGRDALGDQWQALLFLVNRTLASGWTIGRGQVLLTGPLGAAVPLHKGLYVADFGSLGRIEWRSE